MVQVEYDELAGGRPGKVPWVTIASLSTIEKRSGSVTMQARIPRRRSHISSGRRTPPTLNDTAGDVEAGFRC
jgi:hypothetical protein